MLEYCAPRDWMCEPLIIKGGSVAIELATAAIEAGLDVVNGLHEFLADDAEIATELKHLSNHITQGPEPPVARQEP